MTFAILHQDLEYQEEIIKEELEKEFNQPVDLLDIREIKKEDLLKYDTIINRVFASVANRNYEDNETALELLTYAENNNITCLNNLFTTKIDYNKYFAYQTLKENGILTPETYFINNTKNINDAIDFANQYNYPVVLKRNMGGRAEDIFLIKNKNDLKNKLDDRLSNNNPYKAGYIVQEFVKSTLDHDYRISIINDKVVFTNTRSLIPTDSEIKWLASASQGSKVEKIEAPYEIADIALKTNKTIEAFMNEIDIIVTEKGPCIIENNPTPNFNPKSETRRAMLALTLNEIKKILK